MRILKQGVQSGVNIEDFNVILIMKWKAQARKINLFTCVITSSFEIVLLEGKASVNNELLYPRRINFERLLFAVKKIDKQAAY